MIMAAYNNSVGCLMTELETDLPGFVKWFLAIAAVGALGWIPGAEKISRMLLGLVLLVLVLSNYTNLISGFQALGSGQSGQAQQPNPDPSSAYIANPNAPQITNAEVYGTGSGSSSAQAVNINAAAQQPIYSSQYGAYDPGQFLASFAAGFGGFGGIV